MFLILGVPLIIGMLVGHKFPEFAKRSNTPMRRLSLLVFFLFVSVAFSKNADLFGQYWHIFVWYVLAQNTIALALGYFSGRLFKLDKADVRALTFEVGIQNSGLGLVLLFTFMPQLGGAIIITAFWSVWHLISGTLLALNWSRQRQLQEETA